MLNNYGKTTQELEDIGRNTMMNRIGAFLRKKAAKSGDVREKYLAPVSINGTSMPLAVAVRLYEDQQMKHSDNMVARNQGGLIAATNRKRDVIDGNGQYAAMCDEITENWLKSPEGVIWSVQQDMLKEAQED